MPDSEATRNFSPTGKGRVFRYRSTTLLAIMLLTSVTMALLRAVRTASERTATVVNQLHAARATLGLGSWFTATDSARGVPSTVMPSWTKTLFGAYAFTDIIRVDAGYRRLSSADIDLVCQLPRMRFLAVFGDGFGDDDWSRLASLGRIETLCLSGTAVTDSGFAVLDRMDSLVSLDLRGGTAGDEAMRRIAAASRLTWLSLYEVPITDEGLAAICDVPTLKTLHIVNAEVTDNAVQRLPRLRQLSVLTLDGTKITGSALKYLERAANLRDLSLQGVALGDDDLPPLASLELRRLNLAHTAMTDSGLRTLSGMHSLEWLCLMGTRVSDEGIAALAELKRLDTLIVVATSVTDAGVKHLRSSVPVRVVYR